MNKFFHKPPQLMVEKTILVFAFKNERKNHLDKIEIKFYNQNQTRTHRTTPLIG